MSLKRCRGTQSIVVYRCECGRSGTRWGDRSVGCGLVAEFDFRTSVYSHGTCALHSVGLQVSCFVFLPLHLVLGSLAAGKEEKLTIRSSIIFLFGLLRMNECVCMCVCECVRVIAKRHRHRSIMDWNRLQWPLSRLTGNWSLSFTSSR